MNKKILIISYFFPPTSGVAGRRWAKFAKYLQRKGYDVKVIAAKVPNNEKSNWINDIKQLEKENRVTYIKSGYPSYMYHSRSFFDKIMYRVSLTYLKLRVKGQYYDPSALWEKHLIPVVEEYIKEGYGTIVATGAPFRYLTFLGKLKTKYKDIKLIADIRDLWTMNQTSFGYKDLSLKRLTFERELEKLIVQKFDYIITVSDEIASYFSQINKSTNCKFLTIGNGFDVDDMKLPDGYQTRLSKKLKFVYIGTLYPPVLNKLEELIEALDQIKEQYNELYAMLQLDFYGEVPNKFYDIVNNHNEIIQFHGKISISEVATTIYESSAGMVFLPDDITYAFITKFLEYIPYRKPLLIFSKQGRIGEYIETNGLGFTILQGNMFNTLLNALKEISDGYQVNEDFNLSQYNIEYLTDELVNVLFS